MDEQRGGSDEQPKKGITMYQRSRVLLLSEADVLVGDARRIEAALTVCRCSAEATYCETIEVAEHTLPER